jgi:hypothetical protein
MRESCDPLTQEVIDATLSYWLVWRARDFDAGEKVLARIREAGWPWDWDRRHLKRVRELQKAGKKGKPLQHPAIPKDGQML